MPQSKPRYKLTEQGKQKLDEALNKIYPNGWNVSELGRNVNLHRSTIGRLIDAKEGVNQKTIELFFERLDEIFKFQEKGNLHLDENDYKIFDVSKVEKHAQKQTKITPSKRPEIQRETIFSEIENSSIGQENILPEKHNREIPSWQRLLEIQILENITTNTNAVSPGFDITNYREILQCSYAYLKLYTLDRSDKFNSIRLSNIFIEPTVRQTFSPVRHESSLNLLSQQCEPRQIETGLSTNFLESSQFQYFRPPIQKALAAIANSQRTVILGDPGSGKSMLSQYLALQWVEGKTETLPLLVELRKYTLSQVNNFLEFFHQGRGFNWQFDQHLLHQYLQAYPALIMFDGLDEVFDFATQSIIVDEIIRFVQQYPKVRVLVTSRTNGYNPEYLQHAGFYHFTLQPLDDNEIHDFIERWYALTLSNSLDRTQAINRLENSISNSKGIRNLAENTLFLTLMVIVNQQQDLPHARADLYERVSKVLLHQWDFERKRLQLSVDEIGWRDKQEMLFSVAYEMQISDYEFKRNLISGERLIQLFTDYLQNRSFSQPHEKAIRLIQQLQSRSFILCHYEDENYGFIHRTFLEYFCAMEIVRRFDKLDALSYENLKQNIFIKYWKDETWQEILWLILGKIDTRFSIRILKHLANNYHSVTKNENILFLARGLLEIKNKEGSELNNLSNTLLEKLKETVERKSYILATRDYYLTSEEHLQLLQFCTEAVSIIAALWKNEANTLPWIKRRIQSETSDIRASAIQSLVHFWKEDPNTLSFLKSYDLTDEDWNVQQVLVRELAKNWQNDSEVLTIIQRFAQCTDKPNLQKIALKELATRWYSEENTVILLRKYAQNTQCSSDVRSEAIVELVRGWVDESWMLDFLVDRATNDPCIQSYQPSFNPRFRAIESLINHYPNHPKTFKIVQDIITQYPDNSLREWLEYQIKNNGRNRSK